MLVASSLMNITWPTDGKLVNNGDGTFTYTPFADFHGSDSFEYTVRDDEGGLGKVYEVLSEALVDGGQRSQLDHRWTVDIPGEEALSLVVTGYHDSTTEAFRFEYSVDGTNWIPTDLVLTNAVQFLTFDLPSGIPGPLHLRVVDTDQSPGEITLDRVFVDDLYVAYRPQPNPALPEVRISDVIVAEGPPSEAELTVTRSGDTSESVTVTYELVGGTATAGVDFAFHGPRMLQLAPGQTQATIRIPLADDTAPEPDEAFYVRLSQPVRARIADAEGQVTILASDNPLAPGGAGPTLPSPVIDPKNEAPRVTQVQVGSSQWSQEFRDAGEGTEWGAGFGYTIPTGPRQSDPLPWANLDQIRVRFSDPVASFNPGDHVRIEAVAAGNDTARIDHVELDATQTLLTLHFETPLDANRYRLVLSDDVRNQFGAQLDGEWRTDVSEISGDGRAGGNFQFQFNVLPGDSDQSGEVQASDGESILARLFAALGDDRDGYSIFDDLNGDGQIRANDGVVPFSRLGQHLPDVAPAVESFSLFARHDDALAEIELQPSDSLAAGDLEQLARIRPRWQPRLTKPNRGVFFA